MRFSKRIGFDLAPIKIVAIFAVGLFALVGQALAGTDPEPPRKEKIAHGIAMYGAPALPPDFDHFPYANPNAPKGGHVRLGVVGSFGNLNALNSKFMGGAPPAQLLASVYEGLMARSQDELNTYYGLIARSVEIDDAREHMTFRLDPRAHFSDGVPITSADVLFTFDLLKAKGRPDYRMAYAFVKAIDAPDAHTVRFDLTGAKERGLPLALAAMRIVPKHTTDAEHFEDATFAAPIGSGPYVVTEVKPGERVVLRRDPNYWGKDIPTRRGLFNFDEIDVEYYRDDQTLFEALKAGLIDFFWETSATRWASGYDFAALRDKRVVKEVLRSGHLESVKDFTFNMRNDLFRDVRLREAVAMMLDFEWINANFYSGLYVRTNSFFDESEFSCAGRPASVAERELITRFPGAVREDILEGRWRPPTHDGTGRDRELARRALELLASAGYKLTNGELVKDGVPVRFEIMVRNRDDERLALNFSESLKKIGVDAQVRLLEETAYHNRWQKHQFDMILVGWANNAVPGREQYWRWASSTSRQEVTANLAGVASPAIDAALDALLGAQSYDELVDAARALDRLLLSGFYVAHLFHTPDSWVAHPSWLARPEREPLRKAPPFGFVLEEWWSTRS